MKKLVLAISIYTLSLNQISVSAQIHTTTDEHQIVMIKDFIQDADEAVWCNENGNIDFRNDDMEFQKDQLGKSNVQFGMVDADVNLIYLPERDLFISELSKEDQDMIAYQYHSGQHIRFPAVQVHFGEQNNFVQGIYQVTLPENLKLIQLEVNYDIFLENVNQECDTDFFVEVYERSTLDSTNWVKTGVVKNYQIDHLLREGKPIQKPIFETNNQLFRSHMYNAKLSDWRGKEVQIVLTSKTGDGNRHSNGRWTQARLVGATFDIKMGQVEKLGTVKNQ